MTDTPGFSAASLLDPDAHASGSCREVWRVMQESFPVHWNPEGEYPGFWSITRHEDVHEVYSNPQIFSSEQGVLLRPRRIGTDPGGGLTLALTDPPRHRALRRLMAPWFTDRSLRLLEESIREDARNLLRLGAERGAIDFSHDIAVPMTLFAVSRLLGVQEQDRQDLVGWVDDSFRNNRPLAVNREFVIYFLELMERQLHKSNQDLLGALVFGDVEGELLSEEEILLNCENLIGAAENGGLSMAAGFVAFVEHPDQWRALSRDLRLMPGAVEEVLRWTSSATHSMRTTRNATTLRGQPIAAGEKVVLWLPPANRDPRVFSEPDRFDITRHPNRHLALATGEHVCIGGTLSRIQIRVLLTELLETNYRIEPDGPVSYLSSIMVNGPACIPLRIS
jgi:cytochrome P450